MRNPPKEILALVGLLCAMYGCRGDRHVEVIELAAQAPEPIRAKEAPAPRPAPVKAPVQAAPAMPTAPTGWSATPPHAGLELRMERVGDRLIATSDAFEIEMPVPEFGECTEDATQLEAPEMMADADVRERPVWLALLGQSESAAIRLSTRGALLVIDDGCQRSADITNALIGTRETSRDPIFDAELVAPEESYDADNVRLKRRGRTKGLIYVDGEPLIDVSFFNGESTLTARELDDQRWIQLLVTREWEYTANDGAVGREHTLVWMPRKDDTPLLVQENDYRYGMDGLAFEEADVVSTRVEAHAGGLLEARGTRHSVYVQNAGRDLCETTEQAFAFRHYDESVTWAFTSTGSKKPFKLGTAVARATFAGGCLDVAQKQLKKRRREHLTKRAPDAPVRWRTGSRIRP